MMKRKYYLRGLGFGILITTLVFILTGSKEISDEEVIRRAEQLGYTKVENNVSPTIDLNGLKDKGTPTPGIIVSPIETPMPEATITPETSPTEAPESTPTVMATPTPTVTLMPKPTDTPVPTEIPTPTETAENVIGAEIKVIVERGDSATVVCAKMEQAGVIENANDFRDYLVGNGWTGNINIGTYSFTNDMSFEELAKILIGR